MITKKEYIFDCANCNGDSTVKAINKYNDHSGITELKVYKCTSCKHQYGVKGLNNLNEKTKPKRSEVNQC